MSEPGRIDALDGLRGVAAMSVVLGHTIAVAFPVLGWGPIPIGSYAAAQAALWNSPLQIFCNGGPWVCVFFLLSGLVLTRAAERSSADLGTLVLRRYARLTVPSFCACLFALACLALFPRAAGDLTRVTGHSFVNVVDGALDTNVLHFLRTVLVDLYRGNVVKLDPPLWTMRVELFGSIGIYLLVRLVPPRWQVPLAIAATLFFLCRSGQPIFYAAFPIGFLCERAWRAGYLRTTGLLWLVPLAVGLAFGGDQAWLGTIKSEMTARHGELTVSNLLATVSACGLFLAVLTSAALQRLLASAAGRFLGRNSFAIYLLHFPLLAGPFAAAWAAHAQDGKPVAWTIAAIFLALLFVCAIAFTRLVDAPLLAALHRVKLRLRRRAPVAAAD